MTQATTLYLLRHAESAPSRLLPERDWPLSARGARQADALVRQLAGLHVDHVVASPYRRAIDTVAPVAHAGCRGVHVEHDLHERILTDGYSDDWAALVGAAWDDWSLAHPGGESGFVCQRRMTACLRRIAAEYDGARVLACSHGNAIALFLNTLDRRVGRGVWRRMRTPDLFRIECGADAWRWDRRFLHPIEAVD
jgi:2,3-bisphosphoglycerate-dependent phosphoglycerate mutase